MLTGCIAMGTGEVFESTVYHVTQEEQDSGPKACCMGQTHQQAYHRQLIPWIAPLHLAWADESCRCIITNNENSL